MNAQYYIEEAARIFDTVWPMLAIFAGLFIISGLVRVIVNNLKDERDPDRLFADMDIPEIEITIKPKRKNDNYREFVGMNADGEMIFKEKRKNDQQD